MSNRYHPLPEARQLALRFTAGIFGLVTFGALVFVAFVK